MSGATRRPLGGTGWTVSPLGLGCASYWARRDFSEQRARAVLAAALEAGVTVLDTGGSYARGHAEQRLGRLLRVLGAVPGMPGAPQDLLVATKAGTVPGERGRLVKDFRPDAIVRQVEASLRRLRLDRVGLLQLHGPEPADLTDDLTQALERLRTDGKVALLGLNGFDPVIRHAIGRAPFDVLMPFVSVLAPGGAALAADAAAAGQGVLAAGPLARMAFAPPVADWLWRPSGLWYLARAFRHGPGPVMQARELRPALVAPADDRTGWTPAGLALAWVLSRPGVAAAVVGTTRPAHVTALAAAADHPLPPAVEAAVAAVHASWARAS